MATKLEIDDISPGMYLTVLAARSQQIRVTSRHPSPRKIMEAVAEQMTHVHEDCPQPGVPMKVLSLSLPFMLYQVLKPGGELSAPLVIDTRKFIFGRMDEHYVRCIAMFVP